MTKPTIAELEKLIASGADVRLEPDGTVVVKQDRKIWGEIYIGEDGKAHLDCHIHSSVTFEEAHTALVKFVGLLQDTIDRGGECPLHVHEKVEDQGHRRTDVQAVPD